MKSVIDEARIRQNIYIEILSPRTVLRKLQKTNCDKIRGKRRDLGI